VGVDVMDLGWSLDGGNHSSITWFEEVAMTTPFLPLVARGVQLDHMVKDDSLFVHQRWRQSHLHRTCGRWRSLLAQ
jgi:hypothetical protein